MESHPTHAKIKFIKDKSRSCISTSDIIEFINNPPKHSKDYDKHKVYTYRLFDDDDINYTTHGIQIGELCDEEESDKQSRRGIFAKLDDSVIEAYYEDSEAQKGQNKEIKKKLKQKDKEIQKSIILAKQKNLMSSELTFDRYESCSSSKVDDSLKNTEACNTINERKESDSSHRILKTKCAALQLDNIQLQKNYDELKVKYNKLNAEFKIKSQELESYINYNKNLQEMLFSNKKDKALRTPKNSMDIQQKKNVLIRKESTPKSRPIENKLTPIKHLERVIYEKGLETNESDEEINIKKESNQSIHPIETPKLESNNESCAIKRLGSLIEKEDLRKPKKKKVESNVDKIDEQSVLQSSKKNIDLTDDYNNYDDYSDHVNNNTTDEENNEPNLSQKQNILENNDVMSDTTPEKVKSKRKVNPRRITSDEESSGKNVNDEDTNPKNEEIKLELKDKSTSGKKFGEKYHDPQTNNKMIYIKHDLSIQRDQWEQMLKKKNQSIFTKAVFRYFHTDEECLKLCVKLGENVRTPNGVNKRILISPEKSDAIEKCLEYYLKKMKLTKTEQELKAELQKKNHYIGEEIGKLLKAEKIKIKKKEEARST